MRLPAVTRDSTQHPLTAWADGLSMRPALRHSVLHYSSTGHHWWSHVLGPQWRCHLTVQGQKYQQALLGETFSRPKQQERAHVLECKQIDVINPRSKAESPWRCVFMAVSVSKQQGWTLRQAAVLKDNTFAICQGHIPPPLRSYLPAALFSVPTSAQATQQMLCVKPREAAG